MKKYCVKGMKKTGCSRHPVFYVCKKNQRTLLRAANTGEFFFSLVVRSIPETGRTGTDRVFGENPQTHGQNDISICTPEKEHKWLLYIVIDLREKVKGLMKNYYLKKR